MSIYEKRHRFALPSAYYAVRLQEFSMTPHAHNRCEIMYVLDGECNISSAERLYTLRERQFVFLDQNVLHCLGITPGRPCTMLNLEFSCLSEGDGADLWELRDNSVSYRRFLERKQPLFVATDTGKLGYALKDLIGELENRATPDRYLHNLLFLRALVEMAGCPPRENRPAGAPHLGKAVRYIGEHLFEDLSVAAVAAQVGINATYLQTLFSRQFGCGIIAYVNGQRLDHACFLLKNSNSSIVDIAFHLGYNSRQHFGYLFQKRFGMSPKQYRSLQGQGIAVSTGAFQLAADAEGNFSPYPLYDDADQN